MSKPGKIEVYNPDFKLVEFDGFRKQAGLKIMNKSNPL